MALASDGSANFTLGKPLVAVVSAGASRRSCVPDVYRPDVSSILDNDFLVSHVAPENVAWGLRREWRDERQIQFADPARTVVDMLDYPALGGGVRLITECLGTYVESEDVGALVSAADRLGNRAVFKRLGVPRGAHRDR